MKVVILAGGLGTRLSEETVLKPKPMVEVGDKPILWHIMKHYSHYGYNDFIICLGYKGYVVKEYFANYFLHNSDVTFDLRTNASEVHFNAAEPWRVTLVDTGLSSMTGGRIKRIAPYVGNEKFFLTYGDGLSNINLNDLLSFHEGHGKIATVSAIQPSGRFGALEMGPDSTVRSFVEKPPGDGAWVNGGYFVLEPGIFEYITGDETIFEQEPLRNLAAQGQLAAFRHRGFWQAMDTLRDKMLLDGLWKSGNAPWKIP